MGRVARTTGVAAATLLVAALTLAGCTGSSSGGPAAPTTTSASPSPTPAAQQLAALAAKAGATDFAGVYALDSTDPKRSDATVRIFTKGSAYRVDVIVAGRTSLLMTTSAGAVSCQVTKAKSSCLLVAKPGKPLPKLFDPGLERIFTTTVKALAAGSGSLTVASNGTLPATDKLAVAQCFTVSGTGVDPGEYCLTDDGIVRRAQFPSGTITLQSYESTTSPRNFVPPVKPTPVG